MKRTRQLLPVFVVLLCPSLFAAQDQKAVPVTPTDSIGLHPDWKEASIAPPALGHDQQLTVSDIFSPVPIALLPAGAPADLQDTAHVSTYTISPLPLLACIGIGMAIGGIVAVRVAHRLG